MSVNCVHINKCAIWISRCDRNKSCRYTQLCIISVYHTEHLLMGFMGEPGGQLKTWAKSFELDSVPITRNLPGECKAVFNLFLVASGRIEPHHTWAKFKKNNCLPVALMPGKVSSSFSFDRSHFSYACKEDAVNFSIVETKIFNSSQREEERKLAKLL